MASATIVPASSTTRTIPARSRPGGVARAAGLMMAFVLLSRVTGMVRDMVVAHQFGESPLTDAYYAAFTIPDLLMYLIAGGALSSTFIPVFADYLHRKDLSGAWKTFSVVATATIVIAGFFIVLGELFTPQLTILGNPGYAHDPHFFRPAHLLRVLLHPSLYYGDPRVELASHLTRIVLPAQMFFLLGGLLMGTLNTRGQFIVPALGPTIYNLGIIFGAVALRHMGISGLMWGALAGAFIGNFALQIVYVARLGVRYKPSLHLTHPGAMRVWRLMLPILLGVSLPNVDQMVNKFFASSLPLGSQTAMQFAVRLMLIPIGVFAQAMGVAVLPTLSSHAAAGDRKQLRKTIVHGLRLILFVTVPASVLMYILAVPIIALLYQHGEFHAMDTLRTAAPLRFYALGIFAWSAQAILTRAFYALEDSRTPVISGTIMTGLFVLMNWYVVRFTDTGVSGLAMATTIAATLHTVVMLYLLNRRLRRIAGFPLLMSSIKTILASAGLCIATSASYAVLRHFIDIPSRPLLASPVLVVAGSFGVAAFILIARALRMSELKSAAALMRRRRGTTTATADNTRLTSAE